MKLRIILVFSFLGFILLGFAQQNKSNTVVDAIIGHLNAKNSNALLALMADTARIGNLPVMDNSKVLAEILSNFTTIVDYKIVEDVVQKNGEHFVSLSVIYQDGKSGKPTFTFHKNGQLLNLGIIKARMKGNPERALSDALQTAVKPDTIRIAFQIHDGLIYVPAKLNGQQGYFMFDSGAPVLILRKKYVSDEHISKDVSVDFTGMGGMMQDVQWATSNTLEWGNLLLRNLDAPVAAMDGMEKVDGATIFGLMGYGILAGYQLTFDYAKQELLLERVDSNGMLVGSNFPKDSILSTAPMRMKRHMPIVEIEVGGRLYAMGIDCGANANVIKVQTAQDLQSYIDYEEGQVTIAGVGEGAENNKVGFLMQSKIGGVELEDMYTAVTDQAIGGGEGENALPIEGLLGAPFLMQYKMTLNFNKGKITLYKK